VFVEAKDDGGGGDSCTTEPQVVQCSSQIITTNKPTFSLLEAGCPSCRPTNNGCQSTEGNFKCCSENI